MRVTTLAKHDVHYVKLLAIVGTLAAFLVFMPLGGVLASGFTAYAIYTRSTKAVSRVVRRSGTRTRVDDEARRRLTLSRRVPVDAPGRFYG